MMVDRILALFAFASLVVFLAIIATTVVRADLISVIVIGLALVVYDLWRQLFGGRPSS